MKSEDASCVNLEFYDKAYSGRFLVNALLKRFFSYDQLSKTRRNLRLARGIPGFSGRLQVFEYGFGYGTLLLGMPRRHTIAGCELSPQAINNVRTLCAWARRDVDLYSPSEMDHCSHGRSFDLVCCSHVLEHVDDDAGLIELFAAMVKKGGHVLLNVPINEVWRDPKHVRQYDAGSLSRLLEQSGFQIVEMLEADRWTAWILQQEYVLRVKHRILLRSIRLLLAALPLSVNEYLERLLPPQFGNQQLLALARKP